MYEENGKQLFANNAYGEFSYNLNISGGAYNQPITLEDASRFPEITPGSGDYYLITLSAKLKQGYENMSTEGDGILRCILKVTAKEGNTLYCQSLLEGEELQGSAPAPNFHEYYVDFPVKVEMLLTAGTMSRLLDEPAFALGQIKTTAQYLEVTEGDPITWLPADGSTHWAHQYPDLAMLINPEIDINTDTFTTPNLPNPTPAIRHYIKATNN